MWVTPKTNRPSFCLILKLSHALDGLFSVLSRLHGCKHKCTFCRMKDHWVWCDNSQILLLGVLSCMEPTRYLFSDIDAVMATFKVLVIKYVFSQCGTCTTLVLSADCIECSCWHNIVIFNEFLTVISFPMDKYSLLIFDVVLHYQLDAFKIPKMV